MELKLYAIDIWGRATIADGKKINSTVVAPLFKNDCILASAINKYIASGATFSGNEWAFMKNYVKPSADNYISIFGKAQTNAGNWRAAYDTVAYHKPNCWDPAYVMLTDKKDDWNLIAASAQSGYAASAWLASHNNKMEYEFLEGGTQAISYAPAGAHQNSTEDASMFIDYDCPRSANYASSEPTYSKNQCFTVNGSKRGTINTKNMRSHITTNGYSCDKSTDNSLVKVFNSHDYGIDESLAICGFRGGYSHGDGKKSLTRCVAMSYAGVDQNTDSIALGVNLRDLSNCVATSQSQELRNSINSILSFKGDGVSNSIAIKGSLSQQFDIGCAHFNYAGDSEPSFIDTVVSPLSYGTIHIDNSYFRNIKGIDGTLNHGRDATCYNFTTIKNSIVTNTSGFRHPTDESTTFTYPINTAHNSIINFNAFGISNGVKVTNSINMLSSFSMSEGNYDNNIILAYQFNVSPGTKNSLLLGGMRKTQLGYNATFKNNTTIDLGDWKATQNSSCLTISTSAADNSKNTLLVGNQYQTYTGSKNNFIMGHNFHIEDLENNFLIGDNFGLHNQGTHTNFGIVKEGYGINSGSYNNLYIGSNSESKATNSNLIMGCQTNSNNSIGSLTIYGNWQSTPAKRYEYNLNKARTVVYDYALQSLFNASNPTDDTNVFYKVDKLFLNTNNSVTVYSGVSSSLWNIDNTHKYTFSADTVNSLINGAMPKCTVDYEWFNLDVKNILINNHSNGDSLTEIQHSQINTSLNSASNILLNGKTNKMNNINCICICGNNNSYINDSNYSTHGGGFIVGNNNKLKVNITPDTNGQSLVIVGDDYKVSNNISKLGGLHIGKSHDYTNDSKLKQLLSLLNVSNEGDIFTVGGFATKPMILTKNDGAYFVCFKGLVSSISSNQNTYIYFRKSNDKWYDVKTKQEVVAS